MTVLLLLPVPLSAAVVILFGVVSAMCLWWQQGTFGSALRIGAASIALGVCEVGLFIWFLRRPTGEGRRASLRRMCEACVLSSLAVGAAALVAWKSPDFIRGAQEDATRRNLGGIRGAMRGYDGKYAGPSLKTMVPPYHADSFALSSGQTAKEAVNDAGGWVYVRDSSSVYVNCTHTDLKGRPWASY